jgi:UDP-2-acetamido-2,6-beta-L-arabino-hexul-4-ose reductase
MKILVTGSNGFIAKNLIAELKNRGFYEIFEYNRYTDSKLLKNYCKESDFIFHLAGVNRTSNDNDFIASNINFTNELLSLLKSHNNRCPILISSSIQSELDNPYGKSKKAQEEIILNYSIENNVKVFIYRFPNIFGKWSRPNYNSAIATFCYNISRNLPIRIDDTSKVITLAYIDDVVNQLINNLNDFSNKKQIFYELNTTYSITISSLVDILLSFKSYRNKHEIPEISNHLNKKLYSTFLSFLPLEDLKYDLVTNFDNRGSFSEFLKSDDKGQISINVSKPNITKGNHWHHSKTEKFLVVFGNAIIRLRNVYLQSIVEFNVSGEKLEVVDIPPGFTHSITNVGTGDLITLIWANEKLNQKAKDTYQLDVLL